MLQRIRKAKDEGFTLIELLIVIIILGILAAIVVFAVGQTRGDSVTATCKTDVKSIQLGAEAVKTKSGAYPAATGTTGGDKLLVANNAANGAVLKAWPGGSSAANDDLVFTYTGGGAGTYGLVVNGKNLTNGPVTLSETSADGPDTAAGTVAFACKSN